MLEIFSKGFCITKGGNDSSFSRIGSNRDLLTFLLFQDYAMGHPHQYYLPNFLKNFQKNNISLSLYNRM